MIAREYDFKLKDGRNVRIRSPREEDIPSLLEYMRRSAEETDFLLRVPEECGKYTPDKEREFISRINASSGAVMLVGCLDGTIAACSSLTRREGLKTRHRAEIAIALLKDCWGLGLGTELIREMIRIAEEDEYILQLELDFVEGNTRARALYEKMGFRITGVKPDAIRRRDGSFRNEYSMIRKLDGKGSV